MNMTEMKKRFLKSLYPHSLGTEEMNDTVAAEDRYCGCACKYLNNGGSTVEDNGDANYNNGLWSQGATIKYYKYDNEGEVHIRLIE
jgi:hypothetical protein